MGERGLIERGGLNKYLHLKRGLIREGGGAYLREYGIQSKNMDLPYKSAPISYFFT